MKNRWNINWLVLITFSLLLTAFTMFYVSVRDTLGLRRCVYGGKSYSSGDIIPDIDGKVGCMCNTSGKIVCQGDIENTVGIEVSEFSTKNLSFEYSHLNLVDKESSFQGIKFVDISQIDGNLKIILERRSFCNDDGFAAPQIGFYKDNGDKLILTVNTNLVNGGFNTPCVTENKFVISGVKPEYDIFYKIYYRDEYDTLIPANNCVYEGVLRNDGDVYQSKDGCNICTCKQGGNSCESESSCLE